MKKDQSVEKVIRHFALGPFCISQKYIERRIKLCLVQKQKKALKKLIKVL